LLLFLVNFIKTFLIASFLKAYSTFLKYLLKDFRTDFYQLKAGLKIIKLILPINIPLSKLQRFTDE